MGGRRVPAIHHDQTSGLDGRVTPKSRPHQLAKPIPTVLGVRSGMNTQERTPGLVPGLKCRLLLIVQHITGGVHEDHHIEVLQGVAVEHGRVFGGRHLKTMPLRQTAHTRMAFSNGIMPERLRFAEHQNPKPLHRRHHNLIVNDLQFEFLQCASIICTTTQGPKGF